MLTDCNANLLLDRAGDTQVNGGAIGDVETTANTSPTYLRPARFVGTLTDGTAGTLIGLEYFDASTGRFRRNKPIGLEDDEHIYALSGERVIGVTGAYTRLGIDSPVVFGTVGRDWLHRHRGHCPWQARQGAHRIQCSALAILPWAPIFRCCKPRTRTRYSSATGPTASPSWDFAPTSAGTGSPEGVVSAAKGQHFPPHRRRRRHHPLRQNQRLQRGRLGAGRDAAHRVRRGRAPSQSPPSLQPAATSEEPWQPSSPTSAVAAASPRRHRLGYLAAPPTRSRSRRRHSRRLRAWPTWTTSPTS